MNYPCGKFGDCSFSRSDFVVRTDRQTDRDAAKRITVVELSNFVYRKRSCKQYFAFLTPVSHTAHVIDIGWTSVSLSV